LWLAGFCGAVYSFFFSWLAHSVESAMTGIEQIGAAAGIGSAGPSRFGGEAVRPEFDSTTLPTVDTVSSTDPSQNKTITADFTRVLENYRVKSDKVEAAVTQARNGDRGGAPNQKQMIRQLSDLYSYAVDTQLLVRTAGQLNTGVRQLVTGQ
jgi:hypothetical protein